MAYGGSLSTLPTDAFVEILLRLPTSSRLRFRLVCKRWRDLINERTPERQVRTKILAFLSQPGRCRALVFDDKDGHRRHAWTFPCSIDGGQIRMVGTCNGLLCLQENWKDTISVSYSTITVINRITNEKLVLPLAWPSWPWEQHRPHGKCSFGYHPTTGKYKVVHIPWAPRQVVEAVQVFTLGDASWRQVPVRIPDTTYQCSSGAVSVDGWTYWLTACADRVMALDLDDEHVTSIGVPPQVKRPSPIPADAWQLTNVHGRLGLVVMDLDLITRVTRAEVWVLDGRGDQQPRWSKRYNLLVEDRRMESWITAPHLTHGDCILRQASDPTEDRYHPWGGRNRLFRHKVDLNDGQLLTLEGAELIMSAEEVSGDLATFEYVETLDPLPSVHG